MTIKEAYDRGFRDCLNALNNARFPREIICDLANNLDKFIDYDPPKDEDGDENQ